MSQTQQIEEFQKQKIYLTISKEYVSNWGVWESARELLQNVNDSLNKSVSYDERSINISSFDGKIDKKYLILGNTTKRDDKKTIGKYGEGFKLAILVLLREGKEVIIRNGNDAWHPTFENHPEINEECLVITVEENVFDTPDQVSFIINGLSEDEIKNIKENSLYESEIDIEAEYEGSYCWKSFDTSKVFVGGLYVCDLNEKYLLSYNFSPEILELDRDRKSVCTFSLSYQATRMITLSGNYGLLAYLAEEKAADISDYYSFNEKSHYYGSSQVDNSQKLQKIVSDNFILKHGEKAFPINADWNEKKQRINTVKSIQAGLIPVVIKSGYYKMLSEAVKEKELEPFEFDVSVEILKFFEGNKKLLRSKPKKELERIVNMIKMINGDYLPPDISDKIVIDKYETHDNSNILDDSIPF